MSTTLTAPVVSALGSVVDRAHRINANSFQQSALTTSHGWQYAVFYTNRPEELQRKALYTNISRRRVDSLAGPICAASAWKGLEFQGYEQVVDDGHNTISIGVCEGDGTIHMAFDHHCDPLKYRISKQGVASEGSEQGWAIELFTQVQNALPGIARPELFAEVTYPRFLSIGDDLLFSHRIGQAGLGSDVLYRYSAQTHNYSYLGTFLTGVANSPYINGLDFRLGRLHVSWCYRGFVEYEGLHNPNSTAHKAQVGPNGPENNSGLHYMYSDDDGKRWYNNHGRFIADLDAERDNTVVPNSEGIMVFDIPEGSGVLNQESQMLIGQVDSMS